MPSLTASQLAIPRLPIMLDKPSAERRKLLGRKLFNFSSRYSTFVMTADCNGLNAKRHLTQPLTYEQL
jgi:hypothetical protein